uniref:Uncharacterized protein n=1 Tax=Acrobeloides nanus TaxID=290746 RepID=A0A914E9G9_9BILA
MEYFPHHSQQYFPHHNQVLIGTGPSTGYRNGMDQPNAHNIALNEVQNHFPNEVPAVPQHYRSRGKGRPRSSNHPSTLYMRDYNANRTKYATFGQGVIQRFNEFPPEARHIIEELMAIAGIDNPTSSQRRF